MRRERASPPELAGSRDAVHSVLPGAGLGLEPEQMLDLGRIDVEEIATALADQTDDQHRWLLDPRTGQVAFWTSDTGVDGENPVEIDELDLILIEPPPPYVWFQDMADFADGISDRAAGRRLTRSLEGRGAFREIQEPALPTPPRTDFGVARPAGCWSPAPGRRLAASARTHRRQRRATVHYRSPRSRPPMKPAGVTTSEEARPLPAGARRVTSPLGGSANALPRVSSRFAEP